MESIPREIKLMKQIAEHLKIWFQEHSDDKCYPSGTVPLRFRNGISLELELEVYLDQVLTWLRVVDHKEIAHSLEQERDSFLFDLQAVEQAIERGDNPPLELIKLRSKITGLIEKLEHTAKVFTDNLTHEAPTETGQLHETASGDKAGEIIPPTPETDTKLIYLSEAAEFYNIPKSTLSKSANKKPGEAGYLWSDRTGKKGKRQRVILRKSDCQKLAQSRAKLRNT